MEVSKGHRAGKSSSAIGPVIGVDAGRRRRSVCVPLSGCFFIQLQASPGLTLFGCFFCKAHNLIRGYYPIKSRLREGISPF